MKSYRELVVWQKAMQMVTDIYKITDSFPKEEIYGLTAQIRRCAVSIPSNIAEGYGRSSKQDYIRFLKTARGSLYEFQTQLEISLNLDYLPGTAFDRINSFGKEIERMLNSLISKLDNL